MRKDHDNLNQLLEKLDILLKKQRDFSTEIDALKADIENYKSQQAPDTPSPKETIAPQPAPSQPAKVVHEPAIASHSVKEAPKKKGVDRTNLEKFIGENLINKIGIVITVIGVSIGAKYAIDHQLISPLTRIVLGYVFGLGLLGVAIRLKKNYENFSSVLLGGAMAIMYFITFAAYSFYDLFPQIPAFTMMVLFTAFTVVAAIQYDRQIIAHFGLVGAYAIPFLLSDGSGRVGILFTYMAIINAGILIISFKKYWKSLYYSAFVITWLLYLPWYLIEYSHNKHFALAFTFLTIFFATFYLTFLAYKMLKKETFNRGDIVLLLINSFIFYGTGYALLENRQPYRELLGLFTLANAIVHFIVSVVIYRQKLADRKLFYLVSGLVLVFITIAIPVQLDGNWVTLIWAGEAALLFWIGRTRQAAVYEKLSYPLMILSFVSLWHDWADLRYAVNEFTPLFNVNFLSSLVYIGAFVVINAVNMNKKYAVQLNVKKAWYYIMRFSMPAILLLTIYFAFRSEIHSYFTQLHMASEVQLNNDVSFREYNLDFIHFRYVWIINYSLLFLSVLSFVNIKKFKDLELAWINLVLNVICIGIFLSRGLYDISELRESYLSQPLSEYYHHGDFNLFIRYVSFIFTGLLIYASYLYTRQDFLRPRLKIGFDFLLHTTILWVASSELIHWMNLYGFIQSYKLGLSILWGVYALLLIGLGIMKHKKHLRIGAICLFGGTLIKLFFYDIVHLDTIAKTIVFVSLGILLLIISFLYNKYKQVIFDENR